MLRTLTVDRTLSGLTCQRPGLGSGSSVGPSSCQRQQPRTPMEHNGRRWRATPASDSEAAVLAGVEHSHCRPAGLDITVNLYALGLSHAVPVVPVLSSTRSYGVVASALPS